MRRHLRRPRPASLVATLTFFLAVGGVGYAVTGAGTFQKENELGVSGNANPSVVDAEVIRTIAGVGRIEAFCDTDNGAVSIGFRNLSGEVLQVALDEGNQLSFQPSHAINSGAFVEYNEDEILQFHVSPADGTKAPQADVTISVNNTGSCPSAQVAVLSLTTTSSGSGMVEGSGTVQKGAAKDLPALASEPVRSITGVGNIYARCNNNNPDLPLIDFENTSGETLRLFADELGSSATFTPYEIADNGQQTFAGNGDTVTRFHVFPADGSKTPQADIVVSFRDTNDCTTSIISVLSVTTEQ